MAAKWKIGITVGDINGIGLEVFLKALNNEYIYKEIIPIIYGNIKVASYHKNIVQLENLSFFVLNEGDKPRADKINLVNCWNDNVTIDIGKVSPEGGKYAHMSLDKAIEDINSGFIDALVTGPINKQSMKLSGFHHAGHTGYLKEKAGASDVLMMMVSNKLRVGLVTEHIALSKVSETITKALILSKLNLMEQSLRVDFGIEKPHIAVLGLNPHAGDEGLLGSEEEEIIRPAIIEAKKNGMYVAGPFSADGLFGSSQFSKFDGILSMYHDQGLVGFKSISFSEGVNFTAGLPYVRTSPDHGTGFDIAGKNLAESNSMLHSIYLAKNTVASRKSYDEMRVNALKKRPKLSEEMSE